ncbi:hypothetical protein [Fusibacter bizertensis]
MNKKWFKQVISLSLAVVLVISGLFTLTYAQEVEGTKDETVYFDLDADGRLNKAIVVNAFDTEGGAIKDYGNYTEVINLSTVDVPVLGEDEVSFKLASSTGLKRFYYQGTLADPVNPWVIDIKYTLDGQPVEIDKLSGASGALEIKIHVKPNPITVKKFADQYTLQMITTLNTEVASEIKVEGASVITVGSDKQIAMTVLPNQEKECIINAKINSFKMDGITATGTQMALGINIDTKAITEGMDEMVSGSQALVGGVKKLNSGMSDSANAVVSLDQNLKLIKESGEPLLSGSESLSTGLSELSTGEGAIESGLYGLNQQLTGAVSEGADINVLATQMLQNPDPNVQALAKAVLSQQTLISGTQGAVSEMLQGVTSTNSGLTAFSASLAQFHTGLVTWMNALGNYSQAMTRFNTSFSEVPSQTASLLDGQIKLNTGITDARNQLTSMLGDLPIPLDEDTTAVNSYVDDRNTPDSVQFIMKTPSIEYEVAKNVVPVKEEKKSFWDRIKALF